MILPKVDVSGFDLSHLRLDIDQWNPDFHELCVSGLVSSIVTKQPIRLQIATRISYLSQQRSPEYFKQMVRRYLSEFVLHELDENILIDGKRVFDPHKLKT